MTEDPIRQKLVELQLSSTSEITLLKENVKQLKWKIEVEKIDEVNEPHPPAVARLLKILNKAKSIIEVQNAVNENVSEMIEKFSKPKVNE